MYIQHRLISSLYKLFLGVLSLSLFWVSLLQFGASAWRLFSTSLLLVSALYFLITALILVLDRKRPPENIPCPMLDGAIIVSYATLCIFVIIYHASGSDLPGLAGVNAALVYFILPVLVLLDWALFAKKGSWRVIEPLYWLACPTIYIAAILFSSELLPKDTLLLYPLPFLNLGESSPLMLLEWLLFGSAINLLLGYLLMFADFVASGKLAKYVVLPHIKTVVVDENETLAEPSHADNKSSSDANKSNEKLQAQPFVKSEHANHTSHPKPHYYKPRNTDGVKKVPPQPSKPKEN